MKPRAMRIACIGGGPAGLYVSLLLKRLNPAWTVTVYDRNPLGSTFGWGVVFSDATLENFINVDPETGALIRNSLNHWDDIEVHYRGRAIRSSGHGFCGISRQRLLLLLEDRAAALGVNINHEMEVSDEKLTDCDIIIASDGIGSRIREKYAETFKPEIDTRLCRYTWLGTHRLFEAFTFIFKETEAGWFQAHCYKFDQETSTFIVEAPESVWQKAGLDSASSSESISFCENLFADHLDGHPLISNASHLIGSAAWIKFQRVHCGSWSTLSEDGIPLVLLGDAAATAHFSIGSGTKLAMESAISLANQLTAAGSGDCPINDALTRYEQERRIEVYKLQSAARNSTEWFENVALRGHLEPEQFAYSLLTRSQRVSHENLRLRDSGYIASFERWYAEQHTKKPAAAAPMFIPFRLRNLELANRVAVSPMAMYSATDGAPNDFHLVHFGALALGGAGLIFTEMTNVSADARITPGCAGMYNDDHTKAWRRIVEFVHAHSPARMCLQLGHAGPKGSTQLGWHEMDEPLSDSNWEIFAPSPIAYGPRNQVPREMTGADMERVKQQFIEAARRGIVAGFDMIELHCAHGYLLSSFISPLTNRRSDEYGGTLLNRMRFPLEVLQGMRAVWPPEKPISVRISATDWVPGGITPEDAVEIARHFYQHGADIIDVSAGQVSRDQRPVYGRMFQTPFSDLIRSRLRAPTMAVGNIYEPDHVNSILGAGRADLCLLARPHLADPHWTLRAAAQLGYSEQWWPPQYLSAKSQFSRR